MDSTEKQADNSNVLRVLTVVLMGGAIIYTLFVGVQALLSSSEAESEMRQQESDHRQLYDAVENEQALTEYRMVDGKIHVPLDKAQKLILSDVRGGNPTTLVPALGASNQPTVPAVYGRPPDKVQIPKPTKPPPSTNPPVPLNGSGDGEQAPPEGAEAPGTGPGANPAKPAGGAATPKQ